MKSGFPSTEETRDKDGNHTAQPDYDRDKMENRERKRSTPNPKSRPPASHRCYNRAVPPKNTKIHRKRQTSRTGSSPEIARKPREDEQGGETEHDTTGSKRKTRERKRSRGAGRALTRRRTGGESQI
ncbi:hypothetical protein Bca4012_004114 [Brassica carinata]